MTTHQTNNKFQKSISDFRSARNQAAMETIVGRITGKSSALLSFDDVAKKLKIVNQATRGVRDIPLEAIVGSVGRYTDFSRTFLPKMENDADRWARVASVPFHQLPPIDVYQIGDVYFVLDGNHRVSIARQREMAFISATVTEVRTRAPLPPDVSPEALILQAEYVAFLENTNIDRLRPEAVLRVSLPGQFQKLENHVEVHRFFIEMADDIELSDHEAVVRWYDEAYLPVVEAVREQGILRDFPSRTETDLYIWISEHQAQLRNELGWKVRPEVATADLAERIEEKSKSNISRLGKKLGQGVINLIVPKELKKNGPSWSELKVAARYSDRLFADLLVIFLNNYNNQTTLDLALHVAGKENSRLHGLFPEPTTSDHISKPDLKSWFEANCRSAGVDGKLAFQVGDAVDIVCARAALADLVVYGRPTKGDATETEDRLISLLQRSPRPVLISSNKTAKLNKVMLAYDGSPKSKEALFAAAYLAERWGVELFVVLAPKEIGAKEDPGIEHARAYLEMHEVEADYLICGKEPARLILDTAQEKEVDLIIAGGYSERRFGRLGTGSVINQLVTKWEGPLLVCP